MIQETQRQVHLTWSIRRHLPEVLAIESMSYPTPWTEGDFLRRLKRSKCIMISAINPWPREIDSPVIGFMLYGLHEWRLDLLNLAVHPAWRRRGVGAAMVERLVSKLSINRRSRITLRVAESNLGAQLFFRSQGFRAISVSRRAEGQDDVYLMVYRLEGDA